MKSRGVWSNDRQVFDKSGDFFRKSYLLHVLRKKEATQFLNGHYSKVSRLGYMRAWGRDQTDIAASKLSSGTFPLLVSLRHEDMRSWGELETRGEDGGRGYISSLSKLPSGMLAPSLSAACLVNQCLCRHYLLESKLSNPGVIKLMAWLSSKACQLWAKLNYLKVWNTDLIMPQTLKYVLTTRRTHFKLLHLWNTYM